jgi:hypothetical protein
MTFERVYDFVGDRLPIATVVDFGGDERMGRVEPVPDRDDPAGRFVEVTSVTELPRHDVLPFGPGLGLVVPCVVTLSDTSTGEEVATIEVGVASDRLACVSIRALPGHELTGALLRQTPIATYVEEAGRNATVRVLRTPRGALFGARFPHGGPGFGDAARAVAEDVSAIQGTRRRTLDTDFLRDVARVYREAEAKGEPPSMAVATAFGPVAPESARRWVQRAREAGELGPAPRRGQRGEA